MEIIFFLIYFENYTNNYLAWKLCQKKPLIRYLWFIWV